ncbi:MAG TPA: hypothetical protein PK959_06550 [Candidatus Competibacteraceae bacterium]|nr:hypothetical protein [Candidatus Competibacteraceae bacterium]
MTDEIKKLPLYLHAVDKFLKMHPEPGFVLPYEWLETELELDYTIASREQYQEFSLDRFKQVEAFKDRLMRVHHIHLATVPGVGYRMQAPAEVHHAEIANVSRILTSTTRKTVRRLACVPLEQLTDNQRREHADALARVAQLRTLSVNTFTLPTVPRLRNG